MQVMDSVKFLAFQIQPYAWISFLVFNQLIGGGTIDIAFVECDQFSLTKVAMSQCCLFCAALAL